MDIRNLILDLVNGKTTITGKQKADLRNKLVKSKGNVVEKVSITNFIEIKEINDTYMHFNLIKLPSKQFILKYFNQLLNIYQDKDPKNVIYAFVSYKFTNIYFPKIYVFGEDYDKILDTNVKDLLEKDERYRSQRNVCEGVVLSFKIIRFMSIKRWYDYKVSRTLKFRDFDLFTANGADPCEKQCVEHLGIKYDPLKSFEDNVNKKIVTYVPMYNSMELVTLTNDLMTDASFNTDDCVNVIRVIKFNGHMGLITKIKNSQVYKMQSKRAISVIENTYENVFVDIESYTQLNGFQQPYLVCWNDLDGKILHNVGRDCIETFVKFIKKTERNIIIYAWYGSGYDFQYILTKMMKYFKKFNYIIKDTKISFAEFKKGNISVILKDPYLFILTSLEKAARSFKVTTKGSFPHQLIKEYNDIYKVPKMWPKYSSKIKEIYEEGNYTVKLEEIVKNEPNDKRIIDKAIEYCETDVIAMQETWLKFLRLLEDNLDVVINPSTFTLSQLSMSLMQSKLPKHVKLFVPNREDYEFIRQSIYGGRVVAKNGTYNEPILYADVVSLYPSAMRLLEHGYGKGYRASNLNFSKHGIYKVKLTHKCDKEPSNYLEFVARRIDGKLKWNWFKEHVGVYHTYDLLIAKSENFEIEFIEGIEYEHKGYIFNDYIDTLYKLKEEHSRCDCREQPCPIRMIAKIALNGGGYGKFVQKPIDKEVYIVDKDIVAGECEKLETDELGRIVIGTKPMPKPKFYELDCEDYDKMVVEREGTVAYTTQCGVSILSGSRYRLYQFYKKFPNIQTIYSDTDSMYVLESSVDSGKFNDMCGTSLGQLDKELDDPISKMIIGGPKMYAYEYNGIPHLYCKGVPKRMLTLDQFQYLIESKDSKIAYEFEILRRKLVTVETLLLHKEIKQT